MVCPFLNVKLPTSNIHINSCILTIFVQYGRILLLFCLIRYKVHIVHRHFCKVLELGKNDLANPANYNNSTMKQLMMHRLTLYYSQSQLFAFTIAGFINRKCNLLILGLHDSGKSTLLSRLKYGRLVQHSPTNYPCKLYIYKKFAAFSINLYQ